jgi:hypothetical protein
MSSATKPTRFAFKCVTNRFSAVRIWQIAKFLYYLHYVGRRRSKTIFFVFVRFFSFAIHHLIGLFIFLIQSSASTNAVSSTVIITFFKRSGGKRNCSKFASDGGTNGFFDTSRLGTSSSQQLTPTMSNDGSWNSDNQQTSVPTFLLFHKTNSSASGSNEWCYTLRSIRVVIIQRWKFRNINISL